MRIRPAVPDDAPAIARVHVASWQTTYHGMVPGAFLEALDPQERATRWREILLADERVLIAENFGQPDDDQIEAVVGFISGGAIREPVGDCDAELYAVYLLQKAQGQGIGTALLKALVTQLQEQGFQSMAVWALEANQSTRFYKRTGAHQVSSKQIEIGGASLPVVAYAWPSLQAIRLY